MDISSLWEVFHSNLSFGNISIIFSLILLEGLLSADNALVLAVIASKVPRHQQPKVLKYGIIGAFGFRFIFLLVGSYLIYLGLVKVAGAAYLAWLAYKGLLKDPVDDGDEHEPEAIQKLIHFFGGKISLFWTTVIEVELMDIAFSIDSITAALGVSNKLWVLYTGGILGIITMRFVAQTFIKMIERFPILEKTAYVLIAIIAVKLFMIAGTLPGIFGMDWITIHYEMKEWIFFVVLIGVFGGSILFDYLGFFGKRSKDKIEKTAIEVEKDFN